VSVVHTLKPEANQQQACALDCPSHDAFTHRPSESVSRRQAVRKHLELHHIVYGSGLER